MGTKKPLPELPEHRRRAWLTPAQRKYLAAVESAGSIKGAAADLEKSVSTVSKHIRRIRARVARMNEAMAA